MSYTCESDRITKKVDTHNAWKDMKEIIRKTVEKSIGYLKMTPRNQMKLWN